MKYICEHCGFVFDEDEFIPGMGLPEGSGFYDLPDDWSCPPVRRGKGRLLAQ